VVTDHLPDDALALPPGAPPDVDAKLVAALERVGQALRVQMWDKAKQHGLSPISFRCCCGWRAIRRRGDGSACWPENLMSPTRPSPTP
jgi:hypothetical protein